MAKVVKERFKGHVHCPICTRSVSADVEQVGKNVHVVPGRSVRDARPLWMWQRSSGTRSCVIRFTAICR